MLRTPRFYGILSLQRADETPRETVVAISPRLEDHGWFVWGEAWYITQKGEVNYSDKGGAVPLWEVASMVPVC